MLKADVDLIDISPQGKTVMATIQINDELLSAAKAYREALILTPEEQNELEQSAEEDGLEQEENKPNLFVHMAKLLYQLAEAVIRAEE